MSGAAAAQALSAQIQRDLVNFVNFTGLVRVETLAVTDWASVTFVGARHCLRVHLEGPGAVGAAADFLGDLGERHYPLPGHIVADIALLSEERRDGGGYASMDLEVLTIES